MFALGFVAALHLEQRRAGLSGDHAGLLRCSRRPPVQASTWGLLIAIGALSRTSLPAIAALGRRPAPPAHRHALRSSCWRLCPGSVPRCESGQAARYHCPGCLVARRTAAARSDPKSSVRMRGRSPSVTTAIVLSLRRIALARRGRGLKRPTLISSPSNLKCPAAVPQSLARSRAAPRSSSGRRRARPSSAGASLCLTVANAMTVREAFWHIRQWQMQARDRRFCQLVAPPAPHWQPAGQAGSPR